MFKVRIKTFGSELVYKLSMPEQEKPVKLPIAILGKGIFDKIALFFLNKLSFAFHSLKPWRVNIGDKKIGKIFATQSKIENFMFNETKAFLHKNNQTISKACLNHNIKELLSQYDDKNSLNLVKAIDSLHKKCLRDYSSLERSLFHRLAEFTEGLPAEKQKAPVQFAVTENGQIESPTTGRGVPMQLVLSENQFLVKPLNESEGVELPPMARMLINTLKTEKPANGLLNPAAALHQAIDENIRNEYLSIIGHDIPLSTSSMVKEIVIKTNKDDIPLDIHTINLKGNHYIASHNWTNEDSPKFWAMVFQQRPALLVKLTNDRPAEDEPLYWPDRPGETWASTNPLVPSVTCKSCVQVNEDLCKRVFELKLNEVVFQITHLDYLGWEDLCVPTKASFEALLKEVDANCPKTAPDKRLFVHCGAGVGRTGTFIAAHTAKKLPEEQIAHGLIYNLVMDMRRQRPYPMVETPDQYLYLHQLTAKPV